MNAINRMILVTSYCVLVLLSIFLPNYGVHGRGGNVEETRVGLTSDLDLPLSMVRTRKDMSSVDLCACCSSKQLSFCCNGCIKKSGLLRTVAGDGSPMLAPFDRLPISRLSSFRSRACTCCMQTPSNSGCCLWCSSMEDLLK